MKTKDAEKLAAEIEREFLAGTTVENRDSYSVVKISFTHRRKKQVKQTHKAIEAYLSEHGYDFEAQLGKQDGGFQSTFLVRS